MCYANPTKSLELARARMTPEAWEKFENDFEHFTHYSGLLMHLRPEVNETDHLTCEWAKWSFFKGQGL
jgi:hypothetical protein